EKNPLIYFFIKKIVENSDFTTISSEGYKKFLPPNNYVTIHSLNNKILKDAKPRKQLKNKDKPINICFIGYVRFFDIDKKLIDILGNDPRYVIQFFGEGSQHLKEYAEKNDINNTEFIQ